MDEATFKAHHQKIIDLAKGLSEGIELMERRYHRRGRNRPIDVNLPPGAGTRTGGALGERPMPGPYRHPMLETLDKAMEETQAQILRREKMMTEAQRRNAIEKQYEAKRRKETTVAIPGAAILLGGGWVADRLGLAGDVRGTGLSTKRIPLPKRSGQSFGDIPPIPSELVVARIALDRYPPFREVCDAIWTLQSAARDREYVEGRAGGYPLHLMPDLLWDELLSEASFPPLAIVPVYDAQEFLAEVKTKAPILKITSGMVLLLNQWTNEIRKYSMTIGPQGGGSIRV
jgi:hypothetical protein